MQPRRGPCVSAFIALVAFAIATSASVAQAQTKHASTQQSAANASPANPKIRAITAFVNLDWRDYQRQIADALNMLHRAQVTFESRG